MMRFFCIFLLVCSSYVYSDVDQHFNLDNFIRLKSSKIPDWMVNQIQSNFRPFANSGIALSGIEDLYHHLLSDFPVHSYYRFLRFRVIDGAIYQHCPQNRPVIKDQDNFYKTLFTFCEKAGDLPNVDIVMHYNDGTPCQEVMPELFWLRDQDGMKPCAPLLAYGKFEDGEKTIGLVHVPWVYSLINHNTYIRDYQKVSSMYPWEKRINCAIWRGAPTDFRIVDEDLDKHSPQELFSIYRKRPRYRVCELSLQYPEYINAGFSSDGKYTVLSPLLTQMFKPWLPEVSSHLQYKYLINLDGWGWSNNFWWGLAWGIVCIKPEQGMTDWFYAAFKPYQHFLPVKKDLSNLIEVIKWAQSHDDECKQMTNNASILFRSEVTNDHGLLYFYLVLKEYERLQKFSKDDLLVSTMSDGNWIRLNP